MRNVAHIFLIPVLMLASFSLVAAQSSTVYFSEPSQVGARSLAFAGAITGDNPDVSVIYGNPAALSFLDNSAIVLTHTLQRTTDVMNENVAVPLYLRRGEVVGIAVSVNHVGHIGDSPRSPFTVMQYGYDVAYSRRINPVFSAGGTLNVRYAKSSASRLWGLSSSFGVFYFPTPDVSYGLALTGIGSGMKYIYDGTQTFLNSEHITRKLAAGSAWHFPADVSKEAFLHLSVACELDFDISKVSFFGGFEALPYQFIALRMGYFGGPDNLEYPSYGAGIRFNGWKLDFGTTPANRSGEMFQVTLSAPIWNQLDKIY